MKFPWSSVLAKISFAVTEDKRIDVRILRGSPSGPKTVPTMKFLPPNPVRVVSSKPPAICADTDVTARKQVAKARAILTNLL